jgi:hypothetical protein
MLRAEGAYHKSYQRIIFIHWYDINKDYNIYTLRDED